MNGLPTAPNYRWECISTWAHGGRTCSAAGEGVPDKRVIRITDSHWTNADRAKYGLDFIPQPCKHGEVRISNPAVPHGALGPAEGPRRTILL